MSVLPRFHAPSLDTIGIENVQTFFHNLLENAKDQINVCLPCSIVKYDRDSHVADLRVLFNWKMADGSIMEGCVLRGITIRRLLAGGFLIDFPIKEGDTGWIFATDFDAKDSKDERKPRLPMTPYRNTYSSGFWIPDQWGSDTNLGIAGVDAGRLNIQSADGTQKISIGSSDIKINSHSTEVYIDGENVNITSTKVTITSPQTEITGDVSIGGKLDVKGKIKEVDADITLSTHKHPTAAVGNPSSPTTGT